MAAEVAPTLLKADSTPSEAELPAGTILQRKIIPERMAHHQKKRIST